MTQEQSRQPSNLAGSFWLLAAAIVLYVPWLMALVAAPSWSAPGSGSGEARYGEAWGTLFVLLFGLPLWFALGGLIRLAWRAGLAPRSWTLKHVPAKWNPVRNGEPLFADKDMRQQ